MNRKTQYSTTFLVVSVLVCGAPAGPLLAQTGGSYDLTWNTFDGGGQTFSSGGSYSLGGTIGQSDAGAMTGGAFELAGGFWPVAQICYCLGDMNGDGQKDGRDIQRFVECQLTGGSCSCADVDAVGGVALEDVEIFVADLMAGDTCP